MRFTALIFAIIILSSCGPRRYKCGPGRRCSIEVQKQQPVDIKNPGIPGFFIECFMMPTPVV